MSKRSILAELKRLFSTFYSDYDKHSIDVLCYYLNYDYQPSRGDEVGTYVYKFSIVLDGKAYDYEGWCYDDDLKHLALGIYSHWLLKNCKIYDGPSTAWYNTYTCSGNIVIDGGK